MPEMSSSTTSSRTAVALPANPTRSLSTSPPFPKPACSHAMPLFKVNVHISPYSIWRPEYSGHCGVSLIAVAAGSVRLSRHGHVPEGPLPPAPGPLPSPGAPPLPPKAPSVKSTSGRLLAESDSALRPDTAVTLNKQRHLCCCGGDFTCSNAPGCHTDGHTGELHSEGLCHLFAHTTYRTILRP